MSDIERSNLPSKLKFEIDTAKPFSQSLIWELNNKFYDNHGIEAWGEGIVPHQVTSNSKVGKTYAELIFGFLKDLAYQGKTSEKVYVLELGAGHGRLAFHILKHLEKLAKQIKIDLPPYCLVISDIVESGLEFFLEHLQFKKYLEKGILDIAYFNLLSSKEIKLRYSNTSIVANQLNQPLLVLANYFFDSIPCELFYFKGDNIWNCELSLDSILDPKQSRPEDLIKNLDLNYFTNLQEKPFYKEEYLNELLNSYKNSFKNTFLLFPDSGIKGIENLIGFSKVGLSIISIDKGHHKIVDLDNNPEPQLATHGSFSLSVNFHALGLHCENSGGQTWFPENSSFNLQVACFMYLKNSDIFTDTRLAYQRYVNDFGPDDVSITKKLGYKTLATITVPELISFLKLSAYDSSVFHRILPRLKELLPTITINQRGRIAQILKEVWEMYFSINEKEDLAFELGGIFYQLAYYEDALFFFSESEKLFGKTPDVFYNRALCYYQLRQDKKFADVLNLGKKQFPSFENFKHLDSLDLDAR